jgi:hypothetical protein
VLASQGGLDYLVLECLAERTIAAAQLRQLREPGTGFDPLLEARMETLLPFVERSNLRIVTNMGAADPIGAGKVVIAIARRLVARVSGDRVRAHLGSIVKGEVRRYELPELHALQFVCEQALASGVTTSLALDAHGKTLSYALLEMEIEG